MVRSCKDYVKESSVYCPRLDRNVHFRFLKRDYRNYVQIFAVCAEVPILICEGCHFKRDNGWTLMDNKSPLIPLNGIVDVFVKASRLANQIRST